MSDTTRVWSSLQSMLLSAIVTVITVRVYMESGNMPEARSLSQDQLLRNKVMNADNMVPVKGGGGNGGNEIMAPKNREMVPKIPEIAPKQHHDIAPIHAAISPKQQHEMAPKQQHKMAPKQQHKMALRHELALNDRNIVPGRYQLDPKPQAREEAPQPRQKAYSLNYVKGREKSNLFKNSVHPNDPIIVSPRGERLDIPFFWVIPKSGTSTMRSIMTKCLKVRMASTSGHVKLNEDIQQLELVDLGNKGKFLNVDFSHRLGIKKAGDLNVASSGLLDVAATSHVHPGVEVFSRANPARLFTIVRHPVTRMISAFHYSKIANWESTFREGMEELTAVEYATNPKYSVDNWMTRMLADVHGDDLDDGDLDYAKRVLRERFFVLLLDDIAEGVDRLLTYLDWHGFVENGDNVKCIDAFVHKTPSNQNKHDPVEAGSVEWQVFERANRYDLQLYWYAQDLYNGEQKVMIENIKQSPTRQTQHQLQQQ